MKKEKYGFVYIWYDRKKKLFYVGCHWGTEDDGYICSSNWMQHSYKRRPWSFHKSDGQPNRKILARVYTDKYDLLLEEHRWLQMIKDEELRVRYYNLSKRFSHSCWMNAHKLEVRIKRSEAAKKRWADEKFREKMADIMNSPEHKTQCSERQSEFIKGLWETPEYRSKKVKQISEKQKELWENSEYKKEHSRKIRETCQSSEYRKLRSERMKELWKSPEYIAKNAKSIVFNNIEYKSISEAQRATGHDYQYFKCRGLI